MYDVCCEGSGVSLQVDNSNNWLHDIDKMKGGKENRKCCGRNLWVVFIITGLRVGVEWPLRLEGRVITQGQPNHQQSTPLSFRCSGPQFASRLFCWMPFWHSDGCIGRRMRRTGLPFYSEIQTFLLLKRPTCLPCSPGWEPEKGCEKLFQCSPTTFSPSRIAISTATAVREFGRERENGEKSTISSGKRRPLQLTIGYQ